jgi:hypothetical protein
MPKMKKINIGDELFSEYILKNRYYVDKTLFIKEIFYEDASKVLLLTRPRRFGKTLTMSTFYEFLRINPSNPDNPEDTSYQQKLFKDTQIYQDQEFCQENMGKYPVIFITFKDVTGDTYELAYKQLAEVIYSEIRGKFKYLLSSNNLDDVEKRKLLKLGDDIYYSQGLYKTDLSSNKYDCKDEPAEIQSSLQGSLRFLSECLSKHHGMNPILLIDEYDVPISKAAHLGYYERMIPLISSLLSQALKTNPYLGKAVLTGCLRAAKESIFTGLNLLKVYSILDDGHPEISKGIGFTKEETKQVLSYYKLDKYFDMVTNYYDGYRFGEEPMYCPWDVMNFCSDNYLKVDRAIARIKPGNYWINTSGNAVIEEYMGYIAPEHIDQMQTLVDGGSIATVIREALCYGDLKNHNIDDFWTLLLYTGYLTINPKYISTKKNEYELRIPNLEVQECFKEKIQDFFTKNPLMQNYTTDLVKGLFNGDEQSVEKNINNLLKKYVSLNDLSTRSPKENFYQGLMIGALANASVEIDEMQSNMESGDGYADLKLSARDGTMVVIELKQNSDKKASRTISAEKAIKQIIDKRYVASEIENPDIKKIYAFGICFYRKECSVVTKQLK